jgi:hypothetical protein
MGRLWPCIIVVAFQIGDLAPQGDCIVAALLILDPFSPAAMDRLLAVCWPINLAVAELVIRGYCLPVWNGSANTAPNRS